MLTENESQTEMTNARRSFMRLKEYMNSCIVGQTDLVDKLLVALLADGHLLVEGAPGLAKTKAIKKLSEAIEGDDQRIQFTPDLLPSDITGSDIYRPETGDFKFQPGPIFHNLILADEINRAPAKKAAAKKVVKPAAQPCTIDNKSAPCTLTDKKTEVKETPEKELVKTEIKVIEEVKNTPVPAPAAPQKQSGTAAPQPLIPAVSSPFDN